jgi:membrane protease YdiL (CAAX protease family)
MSEPAPESFIHPRPSGVVDPRARATAVLEILLCSSIPTQLAIGALLRLMGIPSTDAAGRLSLTFVLTLSLADTALLIVMMIFFMHFHGETARATWFGMTHPLREALVGLATVPMVFVGVGIVLNAIRLFAPSLHNVENNPLEQLAATPGQAAAFSLVAIIAGGLREELQRAFMLRRFEQYLGGATLGVWVLSIAFGLGHVMQGWDAVVTTAVLGAFWAWMYLQRRSSVAPIVSHAGFNSLEILRVALIGQ